MNQDTTTQVAVAQDTTQVNTAPQPQAKPVAKYLKQRATRQRYSFGNVWLNAVLAGVVTDTDKLVAHGVKLKVGAKSDLRRLRFETLLAKVQEAVMAEPPVVGDTTTE